MAKHERFPDRSILSILEDLKNMSSGLPDEYQAQFTEKLSRLRESALPQAPAASQQQAQAELDYLRMLLDNVSDAIVAMDVDLNITTWNHAAEILSGISAEEAIGKKFYEMVQRKDATIADRDADREKIARDGDLWTVYKFLTRDGRELTLESVNIALRDSEGSLKGYVATSRDITERVRAEAALIAAHAEVANQRRRLEAVTEALPIGLALLDQRGGLIHCNQGFEQTWGGPVPWASSVNDYTPYQAWWPETGKPVQNDEWASAIAVREGKSVVGQLLQIRRFDGSLAYVLNSAAPVRDAQGQINGCAVTIMDITAQHTAEQQLRASQEALLQSNQRIRVALSSLDMAVFTFDLDLRYTWAYVPQEGFDLSTVIGKDAGDFAIPDVAAEANRLKRQMIDTGQGIQREIRQVVDGVQRVLLLTFEPLKDSEGRVIGGIGSALNISRERQIEQERREAYSQIEIQRRLMEQREKDRQSIAREIHDGPVQTLSGIGFHLQYLKDTFPNLSIDSELDQIIEGVRKTIQGLRQVTNELRPPSLIRFGLAKAMRVHVTEIRERYPQITWHYRLMDDGNRLPEHYAMTLFRIYQEAINNIIRHAHTSQAWVNLRVNSHQVVLIIRDYGTGFPAGFTLEDYTQNGHYGLAGMKERAEAIGGSLEVKNKPGEGVTIRVSVPSG